MTGPLTGRHGFFAAFVKLPRWSPPPFCAQALSAPGGLEGGCTGVAVNLNEQGG